MDTGDTMENKKTYRITEQSLKEILNENGKLKFRNEILEMELRKAKDEINEHRKVLKAVKGRINEKRVEVYNDIKKEMAREINKKLKEKDKKIKKQKELRIKWNHECVKAEKRLETREKIIYKLNQEIKEKDELIEKQREIINNNTVADSDLPFFEDYECGFSFN